MTHSDKQKYCQTHSTNLFLAGTGWTTLWRSLGNKPEARRPGRSLATASEPSDPRRTTPGTGSLAHSWDPGSREGLPDPWMAFRTSWTSATTGRVLQHLGVAERLGTPAMSLGRGHSAASSRPNSPPGSRKITIIISIK